MAIREPTQTADANQKKVPAHLSQMHVQKLIQKHGLDKKSTASRLTDLNNFISTFLPFFFIGTTAATASIFLLPALPIVALGGFAVAVGSGGIAGLYAMRNERAAWESEQDEKINVLQTLAEQEGLADHLDSQRKHISQLISSLKNKTSDEIELMEASLPEGNLLKGKLSSLAQVQDIESATEAFNRSILVDYFEKRKASTQEEAEEVSFPRKIFNFFNDFSGNMYTTMAVCGIVGSIALLTLALNPPVMIGAIVTGVTAALGLAVSGIVGYLNNKMEKKEVLRDKLIEELTAQQEQISELEKSTQRLNESIALVEKNQKIELLKQQCSTLGIDADFADAPRALPERQANSVTHSLQISNSAQREFLLLNKNERNRAIQNSQLSSSSNLSIFEDIENFIGGASTVFVISSAVAVAAVVLLPAIPFLAPIAATAVVGGSLLYGGVNMLVNRHDRNKAEKEFNEKLSELESKPGLMDYFEGQESVVQENNTLYQFSQSLYGKSVAEIQGIEASLPDDNTLKGKLSLLTDLSHPDAIYQSLKSSLINDYTTSQTQKKEIKASSYDKYGQHLLRGIGNTSTALWLCGMVGAVLTVTFIASPPLFIGALAITAAVGIGVGVGALFTYISKKNSEKEQARENVIDSLESQQEFISNLDKSADDALRKTTLLEKDSLIQRLEQEIQFKKGPQIQAPTSRSTLAQESQASLLSVASKSNHQTQASTPTLESHPSASITR